MNEDNSTESKETLEEIIDSKTELKKQKSSLRKKSSLVSISRKLIALTISGLLLFHARSWTKKYLNTHVLKESHNIVAPRKYRLNKKNKTIANKLLIDFPNEIPGAKKIDKYLTPNAKYCLVHIRQIHVHPKDSYYFDHFHVQRVQSNMADIMVYLLRNLKYYPLQLYNEGFVVENKDDFNKKLLDNQERVLEYQNQINKYTSSIDFFKHCSFYINSLDLLHLQHYTSLLYPNEVNDFTNIEISKFIRFLELLQISIQYEHDGFLSLQESKLKNESFYQMTANLPNSDLISKRLRLKPAESNKYLPKELDKIIKAANFKNLNNIQILACTLIYQQMDARENVLLRLISEQKNQVVFTFYGGAHAWGGKHSFGELYNLDGRKNYLDNIFNWNYLNTDKKFSLIEIIPEGYNRSLKALIEKDQKQKKP